jgi:imidazoleglycerol-phosphate dehydratase
MSSQGATRRASLSRETRETRIEAAVDLDDPTRVDIATGVGFFDHMLDALARHGRFGIEVRAQGDLHVDQHHLVEDTGIALGTLVREALGADLRIERFGHAYAPLDESLARVVIDICGRSHLEYHVEFSRQWIGTFDADLVREFFVAFAANARLTLHVDLLRGTNTHHQVESVFKAFAIALRHATRRDASLRDVPSTKGVLSEEDATRDA